MDEKPKDGLAGLRDDVLELRRQSEYRKAEKVRRRTVKLLKRLGIVGYSEPGYEWVRIKNFEVRAVDYYWEGRPLGWTGCRFTYSEFGFGWFGFYNMRRVGDALVEVADKCSFVTEVEQ